MAKEKPLYMVREHAAGPEWLSYEPEEYSRKATEADLTLEVVADFLDHAAENINAHDFVESHKAMAALLYQEVGRKKATEIFRRLLKYRGIHGMIGVCGRGDPKLASRELGVPLGRSGEWSLSGHER